MSVEPTLDVALDIAADLGQVWSMVADLPAYPRWHPQIAAVTGDLVVGRQIQVRSLGSDSTSVELTVLEVEPPHLLVTQGGDPAHILVRHRWELSELPSGGTRVQDRETFLGPQAAVMFAQHSDMMRAQLLAVLGALKHAVESPSEHDDK